MDGLFVVSYLVLWALVVLVIAMLIGILRHIGVLYQFMTPMGTRLVKGTRLKNITLALLDGTGTQLSQFSGTPTAFALVSPGCSACETYLELLRDGVSVTAAGRTVIISLGDEATTREMLDKTGGTPAQPVLIDGDGRVRAEWGVTTTPVTVVVDEHMRVLHQILGTGALHDARDRTAVPAE